MPSSHDPGVSEAARRAGPLLQHPHTQVTRPSSGAIRIGTASWTDPTITRDGVFYPSDARSAEARLRYYASLFPVVEVDSSYYALPSRRNAELWVERTPGDFRFNIKAYALMTGHPAELSRFPRDIHEALPANLKTAKRAYAKDLPPEITSAVWGWFLDAIEPLAAANKLGAVMLQYPRWFVPTRETVAELKRTRERLPGVPASVEFRNPLWLSERGARRTFDLLRDLEFTYVCVDEPQGTRSSVPPLIEVTNESLAIVRLHGHRAETWEKPVKVVSERYRYLYGPEELAEWAPRVAELAAKATETHVVFNNCYANYGTTNALEIGELISRIYRKG